MGKGKKPGKSKNPAKNEDSGKHVEVERQTQVKGELVPLPPHLRPALFRFLQTVRAAVGAMLDLADAAADAITKSLRGGT